MANLTGAYDPNAEASQDIGAIPTGEYLAHITDSDMKPTKKNDGNYLELVYDIAEGEYKGRKVWVRLNLDSQNEQAREIANRQFSAIREATGVTLPKKSEELHYKPHVIRVEYIPAGTVQKNGYTTTRDGNEVKAWKKAEGGAGNASSAPAAAATSASPSSAAPWNRKAA